MRRNADPRPDTVQGLPVGERKRWPSVRLSDILEADETVDGDNESAAKNPENTEENRCFQGSDALETERGG